MLDLIAKVRVVYQHTNKKMKLVHVRVEISDRLRRSDKRIIRWHITHNLSKMIRGLIEEGKLPEVKGSGAADCRFEMSLTGSRSGQATLYKPTFDDIIAVTYNALPPNLEKNCYMVTRSALKVK